MSKPSFPLDSHYWALDYIALTDTNVLTCRQCGFSATGDIEDLQEKAAVMSPCGKKATAAVAVD